MIYVYLKVGRKGNLGGYIERLIPESIIGVFFLGVGYDWVVYFPSKPVNFGTVMTKYIQMWV